jgi:hypothetical protein
MSRLTVIKRWIDGFFSIPSPFPPSFPVPFGFPLFLLFVLFSLSSANPRHLVPTHLNLTFLLLRNLALASPFHGTIDLGLISVQPSLPANLRTGSGTLYRSKTNFCPSVRKRRQSSLSQIWFSQNQSAFSRRFYPQTRHITAFLGRSASVALLHAFIGPPRTGVCLSHARVACHGLPDFVPLRRCC